MGLGFDPGDAEEIAGWAGGLREVFLTAAPHLTWGQVPPQEGLRGADAEGGRLVGKMIASSFLRFNIELHLPPTTGKPSQPKSGL